MTTTRVMVQHWGLRGGGPQLQFGLAQQLAATAGVETFLSYDASSESAERLESLSLPSLVVGTRDARSLRPLRRLAAQPLDSLRLLHFCKQAGIDAVFEVMDHPLQLAPRALLQHGGVPVISSLHDATRHEGEESRLLDMTAAAMFRSSCAVVTYSSAVAAEVRATHPGTPVIESVHPAFGVADDRPRQLPTQRPVTIGFFGRIEQYKGLPRLVEAVQELVEAGRAIELRIIGRGALEPELVAAVARVGGLVDQRWVPEEQIQSVISDFDVLALPYDSASQSGVVGFALNAGVPIVSTPVAGLGEQVAAAGGVLAADMTPRAFAHAVDYLLTSAERYANASRLGRAAARTTFSWSRLADDVLAAVSEVRQ